MTELGGSMTPALGVFTPADPEKRSVPIDTWEVRHSGSPDTSFTVRGYAAVYGLPSLDLGGFTEIVDQHSMDDVLATNPDVIFAWEHDARYVGARTANGMLDLRNDPNGLAMDARVGPYSWAKDLRTGLERRDIAQGSFGFLVAEDGDTWEIVDDKVVRTLRQISLLGDVTVCAMGAYPQTSMVAAARSLRNAAALGRLPEGVEDLLPSTRSAGAAPVAPHEGGAVSLPQGAKEPTVDPEVLRARDELRNQIAVTRDEIHRLRERAERL